ncbi:M23 family metallopeptidase [Helicobacter suis]|uniref:M23 family peptidase n=1 Tax=Helicobacter suis TaxID=104628 RepID=A0A6J4CWA1_9HELI|nr:M23 family metallopeptidase [Helicobacter suis]BCD69364.1 M23 family peptidase [Helicobacter suis]
MWRFMLVLLLVVAGYLGYNYSITKKNAIDIALSMKVVGTKYTINNPTHWNLKHSMQVTLQSPVKIRSYHVKTTTSDHLVVYEKNQIVLDEPTIFSFELPKPTIQLSDQTLLHYEISVRDWSYANFFNGNTSTKKFDLILDTTPPKIQTIAQSSSITYGGSALVVFKVIEDNLDRIWLNNGYEDFQAFSFLKDGYYIVILPWSMRHRSFNAQILARDKAYNLTTLPLKFMKNTKIRYPKYTSDLSREYPDEQSALKNFNLNSDRLNARSSIKQTITDDLSNTSVYRPMVFEPFKPLGNKFRVLSLFGAKRTYTFKGKPIGQSMHMGIDLFGRHSKVLASNTGRVILEEEIEGYGKSALISYGLGVYALYGSLSELLAKKGDVVESSSVLGLSGKNKTGRFDHVHFDLLIQGVSVYPNEWMNPSFIGSLNDVIKEAQYKIESK